MKLSEERIAQMEKELCVKQVEENKILNDKYEEAFQLLGAARRGLLDKQDDVNRFAPNTATNDDVRIVPRGLLEHCLGVLEEIADMRMVCSDKDLQFAIAQLKSVLQIEKPVLKAAADGYHSHCCSIYDGKPCNCGAAIAL